MNIRKLTIKPQIQEFEFNLLEKLLESPIPVMFKEYLKLYGGQSIVENIFKDKNNRGWHLDQFNNFDDIYGLSKEFLEHGKGKYIPFAFDPGGWHFCLSLKSEDYGFVYIHRWTDHKPEEAMLKVADSFEEFFNGLQPEE